MKKNKSGNLDFIPSPVEVYEAPSLPTLDDISEQSELLGKMPKRWKKNAAIFAFAGLIAPFGLSGCGELDVNQSRQPACPYNDNYNNGSYNNNYFNDIIYTPFTYEDLEFRLHGGGAGFASYIVYLTEQEALNFIRYQLEKAGLRFGDDVPSYTAPVGWNEREVVGIDLFDSQHNIGITFLDRWNSDIPFMGRGEMIAEMVAENFAKETIDIQVGVFYTQLVGTGIVPSWDYRDGGWCDGEPTMEEIINAKKEARPRIEANLMKQVEDFLKNIKSVGFL